jgi:hypothetical protein
VDLARVAEVRKFVKLARRPKRWGPSSRRGPKSSLPANANLLRWFHKKHYANVYFGVISDNYMKQPESCIVECERACAARRLCVNTVYAPRVPQFVAPSFAANHQKARGDCWYRPKFQVPGPGSASEAVHLQLTASHPGRLRCFAVRSGRPLLDPSDEKAPRRGRAARGESVRLVGGYARYCYLRLSQPGINST